MNVFVIVFAVASLILAKRISDQVKENPLQQSATDYFKSEKQWLKILIGMTIVAFLLILFFRRAFFSFVCLGFAIFIAIKLYKLSAEIIGAEERFAVRLYTAGKLILIYTVLTTVANWIC